MPRRPSTFTHGHRQRLERAVAHYLRDCYGNATAARVSEFAASVDLTAPYLSRIAPDILGMPLRDFLRQKQIGYAVQLLKTTPLRSKEIALRCGFGTVFELASRQPAPICVHLRHLRKRPSADGADERR